MLFNATNIHVTVNEVWLPDTVSISYQQQGGVEPLYGYMDREFRTVARRSNLVAGTIGIYFTSHDLFFRYLNKYENTVERGSDYRSAVEDAKRNVRSAINAGELTTLLANLDLTTDNSEHYLQALFEQYRLQADTPTQEKNRLGDSDVLGENAYKLGKDTTGTYRDEGSIIKLYYGDNIDQEVEALHNVWILGRAKSPVENSPRVGAEPVMEFYSFIASRVSRA